MRSTAAGTPALPRAEGGTTRRMAASSGGDRTTGGVTRPTMGQVPGREKRPSGNKPGVGTGGWGGLKKAKEQHSNRAPTLDIKEDVAPQAIKIVEAEPFAFYYRHWPKGGRADVCIADADNDVDCPLCDVKDKPKPVVLYNVITVSDNTLRVWEMTADPTKALQKHYDQLKAKDKTLDDPDLYFMVSKTRADNGFFEYDVTKVRASDLQDEASVEPLTADEIADATKKGLFTDDIVYVRNRDDLQEVADHIKD